MCGFESSLREGQSKCHMAITAIKRQLCEEASAISYCRTFEIAVDSEHIGYIRGCMSLEDSEIQFPFLRANHIHVTIMPTYRRIGGFRLLDNLTTLRRNQDAAPEIRSVLDSMHYQRQEHLRAFFPDSLLDDLELALQPFGVLHNVRSRKPTCHQSRE